MTNFPEILEIEITNYNCETKELREVWKKSGLQKFDSLSFQFKNIPSGTYHVETKLLFSNQYNTAEGFRIFEKCSRILIDGKGIKTFEGYYISKGMDQIRGLQKRQKICGYCGARYNDSEQVFCDKCLDSPYLKEAELYLVRLLPVYPEAKRLPLTKEENEYLIPLYVKRQTTGTDSRAVQRLERQKRDMITKRDQTIKNAETEYNGLKWLMDHNINTENCIYYNHINQFCFGWRNSITGEVKDELYNKLIHFPYDWKIK